MGSESALPSPTRVGGASHLAGFDEENALQGLARLLQHRAPLHVLPLHGAADQDELLREGARACVCVWRVCVCEGEREGMCVCVGAEEGRVGAAVSGQSKV